MIFFIKNLQKKLNFPSKFQLHQNGSHRNAEELIISAPEIHSAVKTLKNSRLLHGTELGEKPNLTTIKKFLIHRIKYAFPAEYQRLMPPRRSKI
jgi:hypothetical protein